MYDLYITSQVKYVELGYVNIMQDKYYVEKSDRNTMISYPFFLDKLQKIESVLKLHLSKIKIFDAGETKYYKLSNIIWSDKMKYLIETHHRYPSEYFIKVILNTIVIDDYIVNKPIYLDPTKINELNYIPLHHNTLLIMDSLFNNGSQSQYESTSDKKFLYSEHSGVLSVKNNRIENVIIFTDTDRIDKNDQTILLPNNIDINTDVSHFEYLFHTHPNATIYAGRINEGVLLEVPSASDLLYFSKYSATKNIQGSIIVAPEGMYVIRVIKYGEKIKLDQTLLHNIKSFILDLEEEAVRKVQGIKNLSDPDIFHKTVGSDLSYIKSYNKFIKSTNIMVEYYPRYKKNNQWFLRPMCLINVA